MGGVLALYACTRALEVYDTYQRILAMAPELGPRFALVTLHILLALGFTLLHGAQHYRLRGILVFCGICILAGNLIENALKYTPAGGMILLKAYADEGQVRVEVSDTGKGIPADELSHVFDRFYRVDPSRSPASGGTGLGLSIVKIIMDLHDGTVEMKSEPSKGTTVTLLFPNILSS